MLESGRYSLDWWVGNPFTGENHGESAYYLRDRYKPVCARVAGKGMELSRMVCGR